MNNKWLTFGIAGAVLLLGAFFIFGGKDSEQEISSLNSWPKVASPIIQNSDYVINLGLFPEQPEAGEEAVILVETMRDGKRVDIYGENRMLHVVLASEDREDFIHTVSVSEEDTGLYYISHTFTRPGPYRIWVEVDNYAAEVRHGDHSDILAYVDFEVSGEAALDNLSTPSGSKEYVYDDFKITLADNHFKAGDLSTINWQAGRDGHILDLHDHEPAIYVIVGPGFDFFRHAHADSPDDTGSVVIEDTFEKPGRYLLWTETFAELEDEVITVPAMFWLTVD